METATLSIFRDQLVERRQKLDAALATLPPAAELHRLLDEVDAALHRINLGTYGLCDTCHDPIEADRLLADPLTRFCLDHLTAAEQRALQRDLDLATRIQRELLPKPSLPLQSWDMAFHYQPAGPVSGDFCDALQGPDGDSYFLVGDVAGKGVAAAMLMSHLSALLRTMVSLRLPLCDVMARASRVFCESTLPTHYATLVCARASRNGELEVCNAGHPPPLVVRSGGVARLGATGLPVGLFSTAEFASETVHLEAGDAVLFYTDGLLEATDSSGAEYGLDRLQSVAASITHLTPQLAVDACLRDLDDFRAGTRLPDDLTVMVIRRTG